MAWLLDSTSPTLDAGETTATLDGWSQSLTSLIVSATVTVKEQLNRDAVVNVSVNDAVSVTKNIDRAFVWLTT